MTRVLTAVIVTMMAAGLSGPAEPAEPTAVAQACLDHVGSEFPEHWCFNIRHAERPGR